ncbi:MAG: AtpZ/AtpI family protein [Anaerolineales bacterium]|nr:AtpZ/AtpI family protein [Anaerolineales bacterium]
MSQASDPSKNPTRQVFGIRTAVLGGEIGCLTLMIVLGAVFGGLWLDRTLGTEKPIITIILVLISAPLALTLTYWRAMQAVKDIQVKPSTEAEADSIEKEDETVE